MGHNLEIINGEASLMLVDEAAWHGLGTIVSGAQTWEDTRRLAKLDWQVEKQPLFSQVGVAIPAWGIFRTDNDAFLGAVGSSYTPIQNEFCFDFVDTVLAADNGAHYESAGVLGRGERMWCMARVPHDFKVDGVDEHKTYLLFTTSHDGSQSATCKLTTVRVVCQNTLSQAVAMNGVFTRIKHTKEAEKKLEAAKKLIGNAVTSVKNVEMKLNELAYRKLTKEVYMEALDRIFPTPKGNGGEISSRRANILGDITRLFESNDKDAYPEFRGTAFNLLNAITDYTDHCRSTRLTEGRKHLTDTQARAETAVFGSGATLKENALEVLMEVSAECEHRPYKTYITRALEKGEADRASGAPQVSLLDSIIELS